MGRPKGSKNKAKDKVAAKAKAKAKEPQKADPPDWLRKAMAVPPRRKGRPPGTKNNRPKTEPQPKAKRGTSRMATSKDKPFYDPMDDPDLKAPEPKAEAIITPPPAKPKGTPLVAETVPEVEPLFDEVAAGEAIPAENAQALIAGTLGGGGDQHADAKRILDRMANEANWVITKGPDDTPAGMALKAKRTAREKAEKEARDKAGKDAKGHKATKEGADARG